MALAMAVVPALRAAEYSWEPRLDAGLDYADNRTLARADPISTWTGTAGATVEAAWRTPRAEVGVAPRINFIRFTSERLKDAEDLYLPGAAYYLFERARFTLAGDYSEVLSLNSADVETGVFRPDVTRTTTSVAPSLAYLLDPATSVTFSGAYTSTAYDGEAGGQTDYDYTVGAVAIDRSWSDTGSVGLSFSRSDYKSPEAGSRIVTRGGRISVNQRFSETWSFRGMLGFNVSSIEFLDTVVVLPPSGVPGLARIPGEASDSGKVYDLAVVRAFERGDVSYSHSRTLSPTGNGDQQVSTQRAFGANWQWSETILLRGQYVHYERGAQAGLSGSLTNSGDLVSGTAVWTLSPFWRLEGRYTYQTLANDAVFEELPSVVGHHGGLLLRYSGDVHSTSR